MAITLVAQGHGVDTVSAINTTGANLIVIAYGVDVLADMPGTTVDNQGNTYTKLTNQAASGSFLTSVQLYYKFNPTTNASHTFNKTGGVTGTAICVLAYSGVDTGTAPSEIGNANSSNVTTLTSGGNITVANSNSLVVSALCLQPAASAASITAGGLTIEQTQYNAVNYGVWFADVITSGNINPSWSWTTAVPGVTAAACFKPSATTFTIPLATPTITGYAPSLTVTKLISVTLVNASGTPQASLSSLKWAWFDQVNPASFTAPTASGSAGTTDGSGVCTVNVYGSSLTSGQVGWLLVTNSDGTTSMVHKAFSGPVAVP